MNFSHLPELTSPRSPHGQAELSLSGKRPACLLPGQLCLTSGECFSRSRAKTFQVLSETLTSRQRLECHSPYSCPAHDGAWLARLPADVSWTSPLQVGWIRPDHPWHEAGPRVCPRGSTVARQKPAGSFPWVPGIASLEGQTASVFTGESVLLSFTCLLRKTLKRTCLDASFL